MEEYFFFVSMLLTSCLLYTSKSEYEEHDLIRALVSTPPVNIVAVEPEQMSDEKGAFFKPEESCIYVRKGMSAQEIFRCV